MRKASQSVVVLAQKRDTCRDLNRAIQRFANPQSTIKREIPGVAGGVRAQCLVTNG
jgi:hypothetical protein